jgi:DNA modification methylase
MTEPYYQDDLVTLYHGDCLEIDAWLTADVLVTDPPYGIDGHLSAGYKGKRPAAGFIRTNERPQWDTTLDVRNAALALWGDRPAAVFGTAQRLDDVPPYREFPLVWDKANVGMGDVSFPWGRGYELIYVSGAGWAGRRESPILRHPHSPQAVKDCGGHPTPKPVALMERIIAKAPPGVIADPFAGSGSTLVAAKALGRRAIGVEMSLEYCGLAARRLAQDSLFGGVA